MNWFRLALAICMNVYLQISTRSPNEHNEMGSAEGDKVAPKGRASLITRYWQIIIGPMAMILYGANYINEPLQNIEIFYFILATLGILLRVWAYRTLKSYFTFTVGIRKNHSIISTGPYRWLCHPSYTGWIIVNLCFLLFLRFPMWGVIIIGSYIGMVVYERICIEEQFLKDNFGTVYEEFLKSRHRLIPYIY